MGKALARGGALGSQREGVVRGSTGVAMRGVENTQRRSGNGGMLCWKWRAGWQVWLSDRIK